MHIQLVLRLLCQKECVPINMVLSVWSSMFLHVELVTVVDIEFVVTMRACVS